MSENEDDAPNIKVPIGQEASVYADGLNIGVRKDAIVFKMLQTSADNESTIVIGNFITNPRIFKHLYLNAFQNVIEEYEKQYGKLEEIEEEEEITEK